MSTAMVNAIGGTFLGCISNMVFMELLVRNDPGVGSITTFMQFLFISIYGYSRFGFESQIPKLQYFNIVALFFLVNVLNNIAFDYNIPVPLHMIFRSGSLIANLLMGVWVLKKKYSISKYVSVFMITIGIAICTLLSSGSSDKSPENFYYWVIGITLLTVALFLSARLGISQVRLYEQYGKFPMEALYYTHLFSLPGFLLVYKDIIKYAGGMPGEVLELPISFPIIGNTIALQWLYLAGNVTTQFLCISSVYTLTTETSALTVTLVLTLRKFTSLILSIWYFNNPFTFGHWIGTVLVFAGTLLFTEVPQILMKRYNESQQQKPAKKKQ